MKMFEFGFKFSLKCVSKVPIPNKLALVQVMVWHRTSDSPLPGPMLIQSTDAYMRHYGADELTVTESLRMFLDEYNT